MFWPQRGDVPFAPGVDRKSAAHLDWFGTDDLGFLAEGFLAAGHFVVDGAAESILHADQFFFPAAYLYRHAMELQLKALLRAGLPTPYSASEERALGGHNLNDLWQLVKPLILTRWPEGEPDTVSAVEAVLEQFHQIDSSGQEFRYTHDKRSGARYLQHAPRVIDMQNLKAVAAGTFTFLAGCAGGVGDEP
jgi:hypothetical protein